MTTRYLVVRYIPDLARKEPRNIGVVLASPHGVSAKFLGEKDGRLDLRSVRSFVSHTGTYKQWIDYWRHVISQNDPADTRLDRIISSSRGNFVAAEGEVIYLPPDVASDSHKTINHLFYLLVSEFPVQQEEEAELGLAEKCDEIIRKFELRRTPHFKEAPLVELPISTDVQHVIPSYAWVNGTEVYFQKVSIIEAKPEASQKNVHNAAWIFERLKEGNQARQTKALVKITEQSAPEEISRSPISSEEYLRLLGRLSDAVVNVDDDRVVDETFAPLAAAAGR